MHGEIASFGATLKRLGTALEPDGDAREVEGILNPGATTTRDGRLLLFPRVVAEGNVSRIAIVEVGGSATAPQYERVGYALEPAAPYEFRPVPGGFGCEDPRVTFVPVLDAYVMTYTAFGPAGPRIGIALSHDAYSWERLGIVHFDGLGVPSDDDKDAAFFPEPVRSPNGVLSLAFYHRPMLHLSALNGCAALPIILSKPEADRESTRIAYVPLDAALRDRRELLHPAESVLVLPAGTAWGQVKNGAGTPPVRVAEGWLALFHGVDGETFGNGDCTIRYAAGMVVHDAEQPHIVRYRSPEPLLSPETPEERHGTVSEVVFPTGLVPSGMNARVFDVYYGMADARIGRARLKLGASSLQQPEESAA